MNPQSALHTAGPVADTLLQVTLVLVLLVLVVFSGMMVLLWVAARRRGTPAHARLWLMGGGLIFPSVVLALLFGYSLWHRPPWREIPPSDALIVGVTGHMWWWELRYTDPSSGREVITANEIHMPVGRPVYFALATADVLHSFWIPSLGGKMDLVPGRLQHLQLQASRPGNWRGPCAEFCGAQHARMTLNVVAQEPEQFAAWLAAQAQPAAAPETALTRRGRDAFLAHRCNACHTVRGVSEERRFAPDLTHVGSRRFLGAGTLPNTPANMAHWVAHTQEFKAGVRMPSSAERLDGATIEAIAAWLSSLQ